MAAEVHQFTVTIPAGTAKTSLHVGKMALGVYDVESLELEVPPGPSGLMGFYIAITGQQWLPWEAGEFFVWDDVRKSWPLVDQPTSQGWEVHGYNLDVYDHEVVVRFHLNVPGSPGSNLATPSLTFVSSVPALAGAVL